MGHDSNPTQTNLLKLHGRKAHSPEIEKPDWPSVVVSLGHHFSFHMTILSPYAPHWALYPKSYNVLPTDPFIIDGNIDKDVWQQAEWSEPFGDITGNPLFQDERGGVRERSVVGGDEAATSPPTMIPPAFTRFKALFDDTHLYIAAILEPSEYFGTQAHFTERNSPIYQKDSDFEVFVDAVNSHSFYKEFEVNALNTVWNLMLDKPYMDGGKEHSAREHEPGDVLYYEVFHQKSATKVIKGVLNSEKGVVWTVEVAMAYTDIFAQTGTLPTTPRKGDMWRVNFSRVELKGDVNWTWQPQIIWDGTKHSGVVNMHLPDAWGYFVFNQTEKRDPLWPAKIAAMNLYYAQHLYHAANGVYTDQLEKLQQYTDAQLIAPFVGRLSITTEGGKFSVDVPFNECTVTVSDDRRMSVRTRKKTQ